MDLLPALYIWVATVGIGLLAAFMAGYLVDEDKASVAGFSVAIGIAIGNSRFVEQSPFTWWAQSIGIVAGLATLWWYLFKRKEFGRG